MSTKSLNICQMTEKKMTLKNAEYVHSIVLLWKQVPLDSLWKIRMLSLFFEPKKKKRISATWTVCTLIKKFCRTVEWNSWVFLLTGITEGSFHYPVFSYYILLLKSYAIFSYFSFLDQYVGWWDTAGGGTSRTDKNLKYIQASSQGKQRLDGICTRTSVYVLCLGNPNHDNCKTGFWNYDFLKHCSADLMPRSFYLDIAALAAPIAVWNLEVIVEVHLQVFAFMRNDGPCAPGVHGKVLRPVRRLDHTIIWMNDSTTSWKNSNRWEKCSNISCWHELGMAACFCGCRSERGRPQHPVKLHLPSFN